MPAVRFESVNSDKTKYLAWNGEIVHIKYSPVILHAGILSTVMVVTGASTEYESAAVMSVPVVFRADR